MKKLLLGFSKIIILLFMVQSLASCAYLMNEKSVEVTIESNPPGADIVINGRSYGQTPRKIRIEPNNHKVTLRKEGYGVAQINLETWQAVRKGIEGGRCIADAVGTVLVLPALSYWSVYCRDFKKEVYSANIPYMGPGGSAPNSYYNNNSQSGGNRYGGQGSYYNANPGYNYRQSEYYDNRSYTDDSFGNPGTGF